MSDCKGQISCIDLYLDDELSEDDLEIFERHIKECQRCRKELADRRQLLERIRAARPSYRVSPRFRAKIAALLVALPAGPTGS